MKMIRLWGTLALTSFLLLTSCNEKREESKEEKLKVRTEIVQQHEVPQLATFTATVEGEVVNAITPAIPARIKKILVEVGTPVSRGQKLVQMDNATLDQQNVQLEKIERDYKRYQELYEVGGISQQQLEQLKVQLDVTRTAVSNLEENTLLLSPINGVITARNYDNGDVFGQKPILVVQQLNPVKALINVSEIYFPQVSKGMKVDVNIDIYGEEVFEGKIKLVHPTIDPNSHTFVCEVEINNGKLRVRPGMFARVRLHFGTQQRVLVPDVSVVRQSGSNDRFIFTLVDGKAVYNQVKLGQRLDDKWEILSGVQPGDEVVTAGQTRLINGSEVEIIKE